MDDTKSAASVAAPVLPENGAALSEYEAKRLLAAYGVPVVAEILAVGPAEAVAAAEALGYPVALKACGPNIRHKSDRGLVHVNLPDAQAVTAAANAIAATLEDEPYDGLLVQPMAKGKREIIVGGVRDPFFGPCVMLGAGGISVEATGDVAFRLAPLDTRDALEMMEEVRARAVFGPFRGEPPVDREALAAIVAAVGRLLLEQPRVSQVDINPLIFQGSAPVAVDALVALSETPAAPIPAPDVLSDDLFARMIALFEPESIAVVGASDSPLKWGFRIPYNTLDGGYTGRLYAVNPHPKDILGLPVFPSITALPEAVDLAIIVVPPKYVAASIREAADKGVKTVLVITAGYGETGDESDRAAQREIASLARERKLLLVGPNCAGVASPAPNRLYCGMLSRFPSEGGMTVISQSGNIGNTTMTWARIHQTGLARFISTGNEASASKEDYLRFAARDSRTQSVLMYVEGTESGRDLYDALHTTAAAKPVVVIKGGRSDAGKKAAASHTGSLATSARLFEAACRQAGATTANDVYEAMEAAALFPCQPLPKGRRVAIVSQGGGWGVIGTDACAEAGLDVAPLPKDLLDSLDKILPEWWSRNNPIDLVAGNDLSVLPRVVEEVIRHPAIDGVILLGVGYICAAAARYEHSALAQKHGLDQLVELGVQQECQDIRKLTTLRAHYGKPLLIASDTALHAYGARPNEAIALLEAEGAYVFSNPAHAAKGFAHLAARYEFLHDTPRKGGYIAAE